MHWLHSYYINISRELEPKCIKNYTQELDKTKTYLIYEIFYLQSYPSNESVKFAHTFV